MAPLLSPLLSAEEGQQAFLELAGGHEEQAPIYRRQAVQALALAIAGWCTDPNALVPNDRGPVLLRALHNLRVEALDKGLSGCLEVSPDPAVEWPEGMEKLTPRERLAMWLIRAGADPWATDDEGKDAMDLAVEAGSRSLVAMLLAHPNCPSLDTLKQRTSNAVGRQVSWLHVAAYRGYAGLFDDLAGLGFDVHSVDRQGWSPVGWVNHPGMLESILQNHEFSAQEMAAASIAWEKRNLAKLTWGKFDVSALRAVVASTVALSPEQEAQNKLVDLVNGWLAAKPTEQSYNFKGKKLNSQSAESMKELVLGHWDWRLTVGSGSGKGTWSLLSAAVWGNWRANVRGSDDAIQGLTVWTVDVLETVGAEKSERWLDEQIRPGLTNRGMLGWLVMKWGTDVQRKQWMEKDAGAQWKEMVSFAVKTAGASAWNLHLNWRFREIAPKLIYAPDLRKEKLFWEGICDFIEKLKLHPSTVSQSNANEYLQIVTRSAADLIQGSEIDEQTRKAWFKALFLMCSGTSYSNSSTDVVKLRGQAWAKVVQAVQQAPGVFALPLDEPPPFNEAQHQQLPVDLQDKVPSPDQWLSKQREQALEQALPDVSSPKKGPRF